MQKGFVKFHYDFQTPFFEVLSINSVVDDDEIVKAENNV